MANRIDVFKKFYSELTKVLPMIINNLVTTLYSSELLSSDNKGCVDSTHEQGKDRILTRQSN